MNTKVSIAEKLQLFQDHWHPRIVGELNGQHVKLAKLLGEFDWHHHEHEDELFLVISGQLIIELEDRKVTLNEQEFFIVPRGILHRPVAENEVSIMLFEPASTLNTGNVKTQNTRKELDWL